MYTSTALQQAAALTYTSPNGASGEAGSGVAAAASAAAAIIQEFEDAWRKVNNIFMYYLSFR